MEDLSKKDKEVEQEDPFEMVQMFLDLPADGSFYENMTRTFIEEYMRMGWTDEEIFSLFQEPFYRGTHEILKKKGETFVKQLIIEVRHGDPLPSAGEGAPPYGGAGGGGVRNG